MGYIVNEDGTVTRDKVPNISNTSVDSNYVRNSGNNSGGGNNSGCWIFVTIAIIIGISIAISSINNNSYNSSKYNYYAIDSGVPDSVEYYDVVDTVDTDTIVEEYYSYDTSSNLDVSNSSISLNWKEQEYTINVYSTSSWWIDVDTEDWITLSCEGTRITLYVDSNLNDDSRHDYFVIKNDEGCTKKVNIYQE